MNICAAAASKKQWLRDVLLFWGFWIVLCGVLAGLAEHSVLAAARAVLAFVIPHVLPVFITGLLFDSLFMKKRIVLFFIIAVPLCYGSGILINSWFQRIMQGVNMQVNNEIMVFLFAVMYIGFKSVRLAVLQRMLLKEEENKRVLAELQYLRAQLNPHFLFNALNSIYSLILSQSDKAGEATLTLSELMRFHIDLSGRQQINLADELSMIGRYIELEKLKLENRCDIRLEVEGTAGQIQIAPLIFMPFVENAFKHGISTVAASNFVHVHVQISGSRVRLTISNSVPAKQSAATGRQPKIGVENTLKRLELHYNDNYMFAATEKENMYSISLQINPKSYDA